MSQPEATPSPSPRDELWRKVEELARGALELEGPERAAFLDAASRGDAALREKATELVETYEAARRYPGTVLSRPAFVPPPRVDVQPGDVVAPYEILDLIGEGAMSRVFLASRQGDPASRFAVKVPRCGDDLGQARHLEAEARVLERLDHPNVIRFIDDGTFGDGRPFVVVEYVDGLAITRYCDRRQAGLAERLELFLQASAAVEHVHRHGVVHRDVKPLNLLVTRERAVKLVDFGIALVLEGASVAPGPPTERPMTPQYASPEQIRGRELTTRSDLYSLGVVLYELLTHRLPRGEAGLGPREMARVLDRGEPPPPPSAVTAGEWSRRIAGDLDEIVLEALAEEPEKRCPSAGELADRLRRRLRS